MKLMHSFKSDYLRNLTFNLDELTALKTIGEFRGKQTLYYQQTPEALASMQKASIIESSESSNRIEGVIAPYYRIEKLILKNTEPKNRSEQEIAGYRDALSLIHESSEYMPLSVNVILQLHTTLYRFHTAKGGIWKSSDNEIIEKLPDGTKRIRFKPTSAVATPQAMEGLITGFKDAKDKSDIEPLVIIPLAILDFLCIHPFRDGNGRTARLITLLLLYHFNYQVGKYISLERIIEESKETYYEALASSSLGWHEGKHDPHPWLNYFWGMLLAAYKEFEERVGTIKTGKGFKSKQIAMAIDKKSGAFTIADIEQSCPGVSREMIRKILRELRNEGKIKATGSGRGAKWIKIQSN